VFGYLSGRGQPAYDEEIAAEATLNDLKDELIDDYLARLRKTRPVRTSSICPGRKSWPACMSSGVMGKQCAPQFQVF
jgi:hypothetical protein